MDKFISIFVYWLGLVVISAMWFVIGMGIESKKCQAQEIYLVGTAKSYHQDRSHRYNEKNSGIGLELKLNEDVRLVVGEYKNSFYNKSNYVGLGYLPFHRSNWSAGFLTVAVSGYDFSDTRNFLLVAVPIVSYQQGRFIINSVIIPPIFNMGMIAVQFGWRL